MTDQTCPVCGTPVRVVSADEGTSHYEPLAAPMTEQTPSTSRAVLLAWRERLIAEGIDPALLLVPDRNAEAAPRTKAAAFHEMTQMGGPWSPCRGPFGEPLECLCYEMVSDIQGAFARAYREDSDA